MCLFGAHLFGILYVQARAAAALGGQKSSFRTSEWLNSIGLKCRLDQAKRVVTHREWMPTDLIGLDETMALDGQPCERTESGGGLLD